MFLLRLLQLSMLDSSNQSNGILPRPLATWLNLIISHIPVNMIYIQQHKRSDPVGSTGLLVVRNSPQPYCCISINHTKNTFESLTQAIRGQEGQEGIIQTLRGSLGDTPKCPLKE